MHLSVEVGAEFVAVDDTAVLRLQLLAIEADEECAHIIEELIDPRQVY